MATTGNEKILRALANERRRAILALLWRGEKSANEIASAFDVARPAISRHVKVLREAGLIHYRADHNIRWYSVNREAVAGYELELFDSGAKDIWGPDAELASFSADGVSNTRTVEFNVTVSAYLPIKAQVAFQYWANDKYFKRWLGVDAICDGVVGGKFSASAAVGQKIEGYHLALESGAFVGGRLTSPLEEKDNLFVVSFKPFRRGTNLVFTHYVNDPTAAAILQVAWSQAIALLKNVVEAGK